MALSESMAAYTDCYDAFDRARNSTKGIRLEFEDKKTANFFRLRMNQARVLERRQSMQIYDRIDPKYGKSENDCYRITIREAEDGKWWTYIELWDHEATAIEELD